jgi:hypothetical protein
MKSGAYLILDERKRQIKEEGYDKEHDRQHRWTALVKAATAYCSTALTTKDNPLSITRWPSEWERESFKPINPLHDMIRAGALIAAAIDRLVDTMDEYDQKEIMQELMNKTYEGN